LIGLWKPDADLLHPLRLFVFIHPENQVNQNNRKKKWQTEHRTATTTYPCCLPALGEFSRSWSCRFAEAKLANNNVGMFSC